MNPASCCRCPYKDTLAPLQESLDDKKKPDGEGGETPTAPGGAPPSGGAAPKPGGSAGGKYVPPNMRDGGNRRGESMMANRKGGQLHHSCFLVVQMHNEGISQSFVSSRLWK